MRVSDLIFLLFFCFILILRNEKLNCIPEQHYEARYSTSRGQTTPRFVNAVSAPLIGDFFLFPTLAHEKGKPA